MVGYFEALSTAILPVFAVPAIAFVLGKRGIVDKATAEAVNRFVFLMAVPAITFNLIVTADVSGFDWTAVGIYLAIELGLYASVALICHFALGVGPRESMLLGMASSFSNTVFFVLPIARSLYGDAAGAPMVAIITVDSTIFFASTVMVMDVLSHREGGIGKVLTQLLRNPLVMALMLGAAVVILGIPVHQGIVNFTRFAGAAAPPSALFALGVIMSAVPFSRFGGASLLATLAKVGAMPLIAWQAMEHWAPGSAWFDAMPLIAAGPCGAMPFVIALRYGVASDRIAAAIVMSTVISTLMTAALV